MSAEQIFEKHARKNMLQWFPNSFKRTHRRLYKAIIDSINESDTERLKAAYKAGAKTGSKAGMSVAQGKEMNLISFEDWHKKFKAE
tara:strand:+ start:7095 stop:7352 length:258 start_codon:yes stop_codon:yes gene_type:complete